MSTYTFYDASVLLVKDALDSLELILKKGSEAPNAASLPQARIVDDMLPLSFQVHFATDLAQKLVARASGTQPDSLENNLKTFDEFFQRIQLVQSILAKADKETINKRANETVTVVVAPGVESKLLTHNYLNGYVIPNLFFHLSTAYNIMRKEGVPLGKLDYLTPFLNKHVDIPNIIAQSKGQK